MGKKLGSLLSGCGSWVEWFLFGVTGMHRHHISGPKFVEFVAKKLLLIFSLITHCEQDNGEMLSARNLAILKA